MDAVDPPATTPEARERWIVSEIEANHPASTSGLQLGDELLSFDAVEVESLQHLRELAGAVAPGETCRLTVRRGGQTSDLVLSSVPMPLEKLSKGRIELDEVSWENEGTACRLRAIWTHPLGPRAGAAVLFLPGAAWLSQEHPLDLDDPTLQLIDALTSRGISTLRVERSGLGDSEGPSVVSLDFEAEMKMWEAARAHFLRRSDGVEKCIFGRSLGGIFAPLVARTDFDRIAVWGTSSDRWHEGSLQSARYQRQLQGVSPAAIEEEMEALSKLQTLVFRKGLTPDEARARAPELSSIATSEFKGTQVHERTARFFQQLDAIDLPQTWSQVEAEVLAVHAEYDILTRPEDLRLLVERARGPARFLAMPGVDHFLHERASFEEAIRRPWGGSFSHRAAQVLGDFFLEGLDEAPASAPRG